jgi:zinc transporter 9
MLGLVAIRLVSWNKQFLLGQAVDKETLRGIRELLYERPSVEAVYSVQSQWVGPSTFSYKAEVDFDGTYLAAHLEEKYAPLFMAASERGDVEVLMSWYAEDVTRLVELEVRDIEKAIRQKYPAAVYIELEPDSKYSDFDALPKDMSSGSKDFNAERLELDRFETIIEEELKEEEEERKLIQEQAMRAEEERKRLEEEEEAASQGDSHLHDGPDGAKHGKV